MSQAILNGYQAHLQAYQATQALLGRLEQFSQEVIQALSHGNKFLIFGNGGSASDAQHIAAEFSGRFVKERRGLPAIALTTDTSVLTAVGNDYGFDRIFSRQVEALATRGDILLGISTSGNSPNVLAGLQKGLDKGCQAWGFSGRDGGAMKFLLGERNLAVPIHETARVQEMHILLGHLLCAAVDEVDW